MYNKDYKFDQDEYNTVLRKQSESIKVIREYYSLSKTQMARLLGITERHYSGLESGKHTPSCRIIFMLAKVFNFSIDELIYGSNCTNSKSTLRRTIINETNDLSTYGLLMLSGALRGIKEVESNYPQYVDISGDYYQHSSEGPHD